ncbi:MAG: hypothetical protein ACK5MW_10710 [Enterococcus sp.]
MASKKTQYSLYILNALYNQYLIQSREESNLNSQIVEVDGLKDILPKMSKRDFQKIMNRIFQSGLVNKIPETEDTYSILLTDHFIKLAEIEFSDKILYPLV